MNKFFFKMLNCYFLRNKFINRIEFFNLIYLFNFNFNFFKLN